jgi:hypothetical protein
MRDAGIGSAEDIGFFRWTGSLDEPVPKVQPWPHPHLKIGLKTFRTGSCYEPVQKALTNR